MADQPTPTIPRREPLGGRGAEQLIHEETTTGAESDLERATALARQMIGRWGMAGRLRQMSVLPAPGHETCVLATAGHVPTEHRSQLDALATALLEYETLDEADAYAAAGLPHSPVGEAPGDRRPADRMPAGLLPTTQTEARIPWSS